MHKQYLEALRIIRRVRIFVLTTHLQNKREKSFKISFEKHFCELKTLSANNSRNFQLEKHRRWNFRQHSLPTKANSTCLTRLLETLFMLSANLETFEGEIYHC